MRQPALSKTSEQKIPSSKEICSTSHSGMVLEQPQGSQDAFNHTEPCLLLADPVISKGQLQVVSPQVEATQGAQALGGWLCF